MERRAIPLLALTALLAACGNAVGLPERDTSLQDQLKNPLYAEFYYDDLTEQLVDLALQENPILEKPGIRATVDRARTRSLEHANLAERAQDQGRRGSFISDRGVASGDALLLDDVLYFGPTFDAAPGPALSVYLTTAIDPRDAAFPGADAVRLGGIKDQYGAQAYAVPEGHPRAGTGALRTAVLWDDDLGLLYGFAQLTLVKP
jgi:hypothetical protein